AENAQWDGLMYEGGSVDLNWDNKWVSAVKHYPDRWVLEMAIPLKTLRYKKENIPSSPSDFKREVGLDAKVAVTSSLNLDLTVNPDFSQVEVDQQVTNLDRYELFFPERRQFFLENGDQINNFGYADIRPFFSRRIGLGIPIKYGGRLSGNLNKKWRITLMDMETAKQNDIGLPAQNFAVAAIQRRV